MRASALATDHADRDDGRAVADGELGVSSRKCWSWYRSEGLHDAGHTLGEDHEEFACVEECAGITARAAHHAAAREQGPDVRQRGDEVIGDRAGDARGNGVPDDVQPNQEAIDGDVTAVVGRDDGGPRGRDVLVAVAQAAEVLVGQRAGDHLAQGDKAGVHAE